MIRHASGGNTRDGTHSCERASIELRRSPRRSVVRSSHREHHGEKMVRPEPGVDGPERHKTPQHQSRADQQHQGKRKFGDHQQSAHPLAHGSAAGPAAFLQRFGGILSGSFERRRQSEKNSGGERYGKRHAGHAPIERQRLPARNTADRSAPWRARPSRPAAVPRRRRA